MLLFYLASSVCALIETPTSLINNIGISPYGIEKITQTLQKSLLRANTSIAEIMKHPEDVRGTTSQILQNIVSGNAASKQDNCMCVLIAANIPCPKSDTNCCIGCGYEIYTKAILRNLIKEYNRLIDRKNKASQAEAMRCSKILKEVIMPAITEIIVCAKSLNSNYDLLTLLDDMKGGIPYA